MKRTPANGNGNGKGKKKLPPPVKPPNPKKGAFLAALMRSGGHIGKACAAVPCDRASVYDWRQRDEAFETAYHEAMSHGADVLEDEARRRALDGVYRLKFDKDGNAQHDPITGETYREMVYSDTLLIFLLKGIRPAKFRERYDIEHTGELKLTLADVLSQLRSEPLSDRCRQ